MKSGKKRPPGQPRGVPGKINEAGFFVQANEARRILKKCGAPSHWGDDHAFTLLNAAWESRLGGANFVRPFERGKVQILREAYKAAGSIHRGGLRWRIAHALAFAQCYAEAPDVALKVLQKYRQAFRTRWQSNPHIAATILASEPALDSDLVKMVIETVGTQPVNSSSISRSLATAEGNVVRKGLAKLRKVEPFKLSLTASNAGK